MDILSSLFEIGLRWVQQNPLMIRYHINIVSGNGLVRQQACFITYLILIAYSLPSVQEPIDLYTDILHK